MHIPRHTFELVTGPASEPVSVDELKAHVRESLDVNDEDTLIRGYIAAARKHVESLLGRQFVTATWRLKMDMFPCGDIEIRKAPVASVATITYFDAANTQQTWDSGLYETDLASEPARVRPVCGESYPSTYCRTNAVTVTFTAGVSAGSVDPRAKQAILLLAGHWFEHREAVGRPMSPVPHAVDSLLSSLGWTVPV